MTPVEKGNIFGIGPWDIYSWEAPLVYERKYHGKPAWGREKIALTQVGAGYFGPAEYNGAYNYIDIKPLRAIWEPVYAREYRRGT